MYDVDDVARSVRRYVAECVSGESGDPKWRIDLERKEVRDEERPAGVIELGVERTRRARAGTVQQGNVERFAPVTVTLYPPMAEPRQAGRYARQLSTLLYDLMQFGLEREDDDGRAITGPERIPLYDYSAVPLEGTAVQRRGPADPHDRLWAEDYTTRAIQDPLDPRRWSVIMELRLSWERPGRIPRTTPDVLATDGLIATRVLPELVVEPG